jgi:hypothetical protein
MFLKARSSIVIIIILHTSTHPSRLKLLMPFFSLQHLDIRCATAAETRHHELSWLAHGDIHKKPPQVRKNGNTVRRAPSRGRREARTVS